MQYSQKNGDIKPKDREMIVEFSVQNYRSIKDEITFSFEATKDDTLEDYYVAKVPIAGGKTLRLLRLGMLYGANASGKTNVLRALGTVWSIALKKRAREDNLPFTPFLFLEDSAKAPGYFKLSFISKGIRYAYSLAVSPTVIIEEKLDYYPSRNPANAYCRTYDPISETTKIEYGSTIKINAIEKEKVRISAIPNRSILSILSEVELNSEILQQAYYWFRHYIDGAIFTDTKLGAFTANLLSTEDEAYNFVINSMNKADIHIEEIIIQDILQKSKETEIILKMLPNRLHDSVTNENGHLRMRQVKMRHKNGELDLGDESNGTQRFFGLSGAVYKFNQTNCVRIIDELESSLHPDLVKHILLEFLKASEERNLQSQLLFTTHDSSLLMEKGILRRDAIWFTERKDDESTELYSMSEFSLKKDLSYFNAYRNGKLGALPNIEN